MNEFQIWANENKNMISSENLKPFDSKFLNLISID